jgi:hypothetical protein
MVHLIDLLFGPMAFFVAYPAAAALVGGFFLVLARRPSRSPSLLGHTSLTVPQRPELIDDA